ncbi:MAG: hypothetical protein HYZ11_18415 [Candidatus Tectomicrobia bacterium]|uniref:Uncharacterized protein n=1 Tax=Tectimicrobiota bacterium TaxID=2528274 RepID=A0A932I4G9_UNCTE|nr:hypothetical protein [Candidatus Tectomicrobia bacterium]
MDRQESEREVAERIEAAAQAVFGLPRDDRSRKAAQEMAGMLARIDAAALAKEEEPIMPAYRREKEGGDR